LTLNQRHLIILLLHDTRRNPTDRRTVMINLGKVSVETKGQKIVNPPESFQDPTANALAL
jgi:hypothetical protein